MVKSISRFSRNSVDLLNTVNKLRGLGIEIVFEQVQEEMKRRSNIELVDGKTKRKSTHYSAKNIGGSEE